MSMYGDNEYNQEKNDIFDEMEHFLETHPVSELLHIVSDVVEEKLIRLAYDEDPFQSKLKKIRTEIEKLPTKTRINWDGCCPDIDYPEIEYIDVTKKTLISIIDKYMEGE